MLAVNSDVTPSVMSMEAIERDLARLEEAGFTHVQWGHDWEGEYIYSPFEMTQLRRIFENVNCKCKLDTPGRMVARVHAA